ncbi:MAG: amidohydrolase family protein [Anaerolineae bacterium]|nr:amidohydrolase family protein [Anaerolineae bacterium]
MPTNRGEARRYALEGKVVTMDDRFTVLDRGVVYIAGAHIIAVQPADEPPPAGFEAVRLIRTGDTIYPGLIELHNHLSYNILPLWTVPRRFVNRGQWRSHPAKQKLITGPMQVLGKTPRYVPAIARYVEAKCLLGGVTTSQGLALYGVGIQPYYRGVVRNVEDTDDPALPEADTRIDDVAAADGESFLKRLERGSCLLLHLAEGADPASRRHFEALRLAEDRWAITPALAGIHCVPLFPEDFQVLGDHGGAMVWSPLSNLLLYAETADVGAARDAGALIGLGSDWSPSGSKNLLCELKVAALVSQVSGGVFEARDLLAMVTRDAARILKWDAALGSIEVGKRADLVLVNGRQGDPYERLLQARESSLTLVVVDGVPRCGQAALMKALGVGEGTETIDVGGAARVLNLDDECADPLVRGLTLAAARDLLLDGLSRLPELARVLEEGTSALALLARMGQSFDTPAEALAVLAASGTLAARGAADADLLDDGRPVAFLCLDQDDLVGESLRPHLPDPGTGEVTGFPLAGTALGTATGVTYSDLLSGVRVDLDPLTVVGDPDYFARLAVQPNLPDYVKNGLPPLYGANPLPADAEFVYNLHPAIQPQFAGMIDLGTFGRTHGLLSIADRRRIVDQALVLIERIYVHLPLKRAMHAIDPIQHLRLLRYRLEQQAEANIESERDFHTELIQIFTSVRDLHTNYLLPQPFRDKTAFLPFMIEEYYEGGEPHYVVSKVVGDAGPATFHAGVEVRYWNGVPIRRAIEVNAARQAGGNADARHARALDSLTVRPLVRMLPPDEEWVVVGYRTPQGEDLEMRQRWLVFSPAASPATIDPDALSPGAAMLGYDLQTDAIHQIKKVLYAPQAVAAEQRVAADVVVRAAPPGGLETALPTVFRARMVDTLYGTFGHIRIFTFNVPDADAFVAEFVRLASQLPQNGLILDVRGNGGGLIYAAERLLQVMTPRHVEPQHAQFINTPLMLDLCRRHAPSRVLSDLDLRPWIDSIAQAVQTGATYSRAFPITSPESCNTVGQQYCGPVVLITDALCYSATDIFAAGFQDHGIGPILGVGGNTGAGGANVWTHDLLRMLMNDPADPYTLRPDSPFQPLPHGAGMRVAIRRTLRVGERSGIPVEDLGVVPDHRHLLTRRDLLESNADLMDHAAAILVDLPSYQLTLTVDGVTGATLATRVTTYGVSRLDIYLGARPQGSLDVVDGERAIILDVPPMPEGGDTLYLSLYGFADGQLVASKQVRIGRS